MKGIERIRRILLSAVLAVCSLYLAGCSGNEKKETQEYFKAKVLAVEDTYVLVKPLEGEDIRKSADRITFGKEKLNDSKDIEAGSVIGVSYSGDVHETSPASIDAYKWECISPAQYPEETNKKEVPKEEQQKRMVMLKDKLYVDTGEVSKMGRCGLQDFRFKSSVKRGKPTKNLQTNFGKGYGGQYSFRKNRIEILIDREWHVFAYNENDLAGVTMKVKSNTHHSLVINVNNQSDKEIECGAEYEIEYLDSEIETWSSLPYKHDDFGFDEVAYCLNKGDKEFNYDWDYIYGRLKPGKYRIVKEFFEYIEGQESDKHTLTAEFEIK